MSKKQLIIAFTAILFGIIFVVFMISNIVKTLSPDDTQREPAPTRSPIGNIEEKLPEKIEDIPVKPIDEGGGADLESEAIQTSTSELEKIKETLPYFSTHTLTTGLVIDISIPDNLLENTPWILTVYVTGVDYRITVNDPQYQLNKDSFIEAAGLALQWLESKGVDTSKTYISWGDRAYEREKAEQWLQ